MVAEGLKGTSKYVYLESRTAASSEAVGWLKQLRRFWLANGLGQREKSVDLKLVFNRLVRTRMLGGVGGCPEQSGPLSRFTLILIMASLGKLVFPLPSSGKIRHPLNWSAARKTSPEDAPLNLAKY